MRIAFTSDLHVDGTKIHRAILSAMVDILGREKPQAFILCGDVAPHAGELAMTLEAFSSTGCRKFFVAGNHDVWLSKDIDGASGSPDSAEKYRRLIPEICRHHDFACLFEEEQFLDGIGVVGGMGWYDYSFRNRELDGIITMEEYARGRFRNLQWNDVIHTRWGSLEASRGEEERREPDAPFLAEWMTASLRAQLRRLEGHGLKGILVATHFLPLREQMRYDGDPSIDFSTAYLGSEKMGMLIDEFPGIRWWLCGHLHKKIREEWKHVHVATSPLGYIKDSRVDPEIEARRSLTFLDIKE